jgi:hypothetical protein
MPPPSEVPLLVRFWARAGTFDARANDQHSIWAGSIVNGYGQLTGPDGRKHYAHRVAYELVNGPIPPGMVVRHKCPTGPIRSCVRPCHLELGTTADNAADRSVDGPQIVTRPMNEELAAACRYLFASEQFSQRDIAEIVLGDRTAQPQVARIVTGKTYPTAPGPLTKIGKGRKPRLRNA